MADEPIDLEKARNRRLPRMPFVELPDCPDHPNMFLVELFAADGTAQRGQVGLHFGIEDFPGVSLNAKQCRALSKALSQVAEDLEGQERDGHG